MLNKAPFFWNSRAIAKKVTKFRRKLAHCSSLSSLTNKSTINICGMSCAISVFDMLKIGIGPSSSHTLGPWKAANLFLQDLNQGDFITATEKIEIHLFGSLALTGIGHGTDIAILLGLSGTYPETIPLQQVQTIPDTIRKTNSLNLGKQKMIIFEERRDLFFHMDQKLDFHPNGMQIKAFDQLGALLFEDTYFSIGGGFISKGINDSATPYHRPPTYNFNSAQEVVEMCHQQHIHISDLALENETTWKAYDQIEKDLDRIWEVMIQSAFRGCHKSGYLPGGLNVVRRAANLHQKLFKAPICDHPERWVQEVRNLTCDFGETLKWVSCFAMAVNEENASFGRIITAPTNGAAGVIPAVLLYLIGFAKPDSDQPTIRKFLLTTSIIGCLFKHKATISAAMGGCQAEIGVSSSMAAAALTEALGGSVEQAMIAAEIAMEHHLGLTCDPIKGLVQVPCIERNTMGAIKAITACNLALETDPSKVKVSLDAVIETMMQTALDMNDKYKETSKGGLATNVSLPEC